MGRAGRRHHASGREVGRGREARPVGRGQTGRPLAEGLYVFHSRPYDGPPPGVERLTNTVPKTGRPQSPRPLNRKCKPLPLLLFF